MNMATTDIAEFRCDVIANLKKTMHDLCDRHESMESSMTDQERDASFSVIGRMGTLLGTIEALPDSNGCSGYVEQILDI